MAHRFSAGDWLRHKQTNESGCVKSCYILQNVQVYEVSIPIDPTGTSWELGAVSATWEEGDLEMSNEKHLPPCRS